MASEVLGFITKRRSIRKFTGDPVPREALVTALQAAMAAPSANNAKPWEFIVVTDKEKTRDLCLAHPYADFGVDAGAVVIPFGRKQGYKWFEQDMAAATENLLLAVANLGLGATWCGMDEAKQGLIRPLVGLSDDLYAFALIPIGVPAEGKPPRTQCDESRIHWESY